MNVRCLSLSVCDHLLCGNKNETAQKTDAYSELVEFHSSWLKTMNRGSQGLEARTEFLVGVMKSWGRSSCDSIASVFYAPKLHTFERLNNK